MKNLLLGLLIVGALGSGCRKRSAPVVTPSAPPAPVVLATPEQAAKATPMTGPEAEAINRALQLSVPVNGFPTDLSTLVDGKIVMTVPVSPAGKKIAIDQAKMRLILLDQ